MTGKQSKDLPVQPAVCSPAPEPAYPAWRGVGGALVPVFCVHVLAIALIVLWPGAPLQPPQALPIATVAVELVSMPLAAPVTAPTPAPVLPSPPRKAPAPRPEPAPAPPVRKVETPVAAPVAAPSPTPAAPAAAVEAVPPANTAGHAAPTANPVAQAAPAPAAPAANVADWSPPRPASAVGYANTPPRYPAASRRLGEQGRVLLAVLIDVDGRVQDASVRQSSGYSRLDRAALEAVRGWRFEPARRAGKPQAVWHEQPVVFDLKD